jgi:hypothetical protein
MCIEDDYHPNHSIITFDSHNCQILTTFGSIDKIHY